jgi:hypothetical protein
MRRALTLAATLGLAATGQAAAPFIAYSWDYSEDSAELCVYSGRLALEQYGFEVTATGDSEVVGRHGEYKVVVACLPGRRLVIVAGPNYRQASTYSADLQQAFNPP